MGIDVENEDLLSFPEAARFVPPARDGKPTSPSTIADWTRRGVGGVTLEWAKIGGRLCTSKQAIARFSARLTPGQERTCKPSRSPSKRAREVARANAELEKAGI